MNGAVLNTIFFASLIQIRIHQLTNVIQVVFDFRVLQFAAGFAGLFVVVHGRVG